MSNFNYSNFTTTNLIEYNSKIGYENLSEFQRIQQQRRNNVIRKIEEGDMCNMFQQMNISKKQTQEDVLCNVFQNMNLSTKQ